MKRTVAAFAALALWSGAALAQSYEHGNAAWTALLKKHGSRSR